MAIKEITGALTMMGVFVIMFFVAIAIVDPLYATLSGFSMGGMGSQAEGIHVAIVKYSVPVFLGSVLVTTVFYILNRERQTVR